MHDLGRGGQTEGSTKTVGWTGRYKPHHDSKAVRPIIFYDSQKLLLLHAGKI